MRRKTYEVKAYTVSSFSCIVTKKNLCYNEAPIKKVEEYISFPFHSIKSADIFFFCVCSFYREKVN